jgi:hypothetical protein
MSHRCGFSILTALENEFSSEEMPKAKGQHDMARLKGLKTGQEIKDWYCSVSEQLQQASHNRIFSLLLDLQEYEFLETHGFLEPVSTDRERSILFIRYYCATERVQQAMDYFMTLPDTRQRHAQILLHEFIRLQRYDDALKVFRIMFERYPVPGITGEDLGLILTMPMSSLEPILTMLIGQPIIIGGVKSVTHQGLDLKLLEFSPDQMARLVNNLGLEPPNLDVDYDYIVDGGNLLFYGEGKITSNSYRRVGRMLDALAEHYQIRHGSGWPRVLLVLHYRHLGKYRNEIDSWRKKHPGLSICSTPAGQNDDYYLLLNAFPRPNAYLVTNDEFRDHIFKFTEKDHNLDLIRQWCREKVIQYEMDPFRGGVELMIPPPYSFRIQRGANGEWYIPVDDGGWYVKT